MNTFTYLRHIQTFDLNFVILSIKWGAVAGAQGGRGLGRVRGNGAFSEFGGFSSKIRIYALPLLQSNNYPAPIYLLFTKRFIGSKFFFLDPIYFSRRRCEFLAQFIDSKGTRCHE